MGGAGLAATLIERGLIDEFRVFVNPVIVGGGTPFLTIAAVRRAPADQTG